MSRESSGGIEYKKLIDIFFRHNRLHHVAFRCVVIDTHQLDHKTFNRGDEELGFYKLYYQLLLHNMRPGNRYLVMLDDRRTRKKTRLSTLNGPQDPLKDTWFDIWHMKLRKGRSAPTPSQQAEL